MSDEVMYPPGTADPIPKGVVVLFVVTVLVAIGIAACNYLGSGGFSVSSEPVDMQLSGVTNAAHSVNLSEFRGRYVVLHYWATWCPPCRREMPEFASFAQKLAHHNVIVLTVSFQDSPEAIRSFFGQHGISVSVYEMTSRPPRALDSGSIPTTFLIDDEGRVVKKWVGMQNWSNAALQKQIVRMATRGEGG